MNIEQKLTDALREESESHDVDVARMWMETRDRLAGAAVRRPRRQVLLAAATVMVILGAGALGVATLDRFGMVDVLPPAGSPGPAEGGVEDEFTCPEQVTHDWTRPESVPDDYFVASLEGGPRQQAMTYEAPRYEYDEQGDRAFLRFGNADGTLALVSEFRREGGDWVRLRTDVCTGEGGSIGVPHPRAWSLGRHGATPYPARAMTSGPRGGVVLVDDRQYFDGTGLVRHRSLYAYPCRTRICLTGGNPSSTIGTDLRSGLVPRDVTAVFMPPDELVNRSHPFGFWALYDADGAVSGLSADLRDGRIIQATTFEVAGWPGTLHTLLAPFDEVDVVTVHRAAGSGPGAGGATDFAPEDLPGYRADLHD